MHGRGGHGGFHPDLGLAILRMVLGVTYIAHGAPKLLGGVGGLATLLEGIGFPAPVAWAWLVTVLEFFGGLLLIVGLLVTPVALLLCVEMLLGIILVHAAEGWYVIGPGTGGIEFNVLLIAALLALVFGGPGVAAIDAYRGREEVVVAPERSPLSGSADPSETGR